MSSHLLVLSKASLIAVKPPDVSSQALTSAAWQAEGSLTTGPLVMPSARVLLRQPLLSCGREPASSAARAWQYTQVPNIPANNPHLQRVLCILCWCSPPGSLPWSPEERETAYHPAAEGQPPLLALACSQWRSHSKYPSPGASTEQRMKMQHHDGMISLEIRQEIASVLNLCNWSDNSTCIWLVWEHHAIFPVLILPG